MIANFWNHCHLFIKTSVNVSLSKKNLLRFTSYDEISINVQSQQEIKIAAKGKEPLQIFSRISAELSVQKSCYLFPHLATGTETVAAFCVSQAQQSFDYFRKRKGTCKAQVKQKLIQSA